MLSNGIFMLFVLLYQLFYNQPVTHKLTKIQNKENCENACCSFL
ncbi:hypothetical protein T479_09660 [Lysinibacillus varians]|nr:hypothetical protein T479_09660 [Lysinibacillus varians]